MTLNVYLGDLRYHTAGILANDCMPLGVAYMKAVIDRDNPAAAEQERRVGPGRHDADGVALHLALVGAHDAGLDHGIALHIVDRCFDKIGLTENFGIQFHIFRQGLLQYGKVFFYPLRNRQSVGIGLF